MKTNCRHTRFYGAFFAVLLLTQAAYAFYNPSTGRWLNRDMVNEPGHRALVKSPATILDPPEEKNPYGVVWNSALNLHDSDGRSVIGVKVAVLIAKLALYASDCYDKMTQAKKEANKPWNRAREDYTCCVNGVRVGMEEFPGAISGNKSEKFGVLHCMAGFYAKQLGADTPCQAAANVLHELYEHYAFGESSLRKEGPIGWFLDTWSDMELFFAGTGVNAAEECIPGQCTKQPKKK